MNPQIFRHYSLGLKSIFIVANNEYRAFKANKGLLLSMFIQPIMIYGLLILALNSNIPTLHYLNQSIPYKQYALIGVLAFFMTTQMSQAMYRATVDKQYGLLAMKFTNGIQPWHYLTGMSMFPSMGLLFQSLILFILGIFTNGIYNVGLFILTVIYALIILEFWSSLGILLSTKIATYQKRDVIMTLIFMPISYAAPTLYVLPKHPTLILKFLTSINPLTYQLNGLRSIAFGHFDGLTIGIGILITLAMLIYTQYVLKRMRLVLSER